jgi:transposase
MEDTQLYAMLLGIKFPWRVNGVQVDMASNRIDVWFEEAPGTKFPCAVCTQEASVDDHAEEQVWRHLYQTYVHARLPRTTCAVDGMKQANLRTTISCGHPH